MEINSGAVYLLLAIFLLSVHGAHVPPREFPQFIRSAVESMPPADSNTLAKYSVNPTFGEVFLPLRSAVESSPTVVPLKSEPIQTFIRSSVEYVPYEVHYEPQPYRSGSPHQSLVDLRSSRRSFNKQEKELTQKPKVLCYMTNWAFYRVKDGKFAPENLDKNLCTAIIYSFASLDPATLLLKEFDPWVDIENDLYKRTTALDIPVLLALGGWTDSTGDKYSKLVSNPAARKAFAENTLEFLNRYGFSGLHIDWNYPKCWQSDCRKGPESDKPNFTKLIKELREEFDKTNPEFQLGVAISGYKEVITEAYELSDLSQYATYLTVMSYDYHGAWEQQTGHVSPLYGRPNDKYPQYNTDYTIQLLIKNGAAKDKLIMGIPFYGQTFTLQESHNQLIGEGVPAVGPGEPGEFTKQPGMMAYHEICNRIRKNKWLVGRDSTRKSGPHAMLKNQWVGYEDPASVEAKARYALNSGLGGVAAWTVDLDDFFNRCCSESFPLLKAINRALGRLSTPPPSGTNCKRPAEPVTPIPPVMTTVGESGIPGPIHEHTTWPSWTPSPSSSSSSSSKKPQTTNHPTKPITTTITTTTTTKTTTTKATTTTRKPTTRKPTTEAWWQTTPSFKPTTIPPPAVVMPVFSPEGEKCETGAIKFDPMNCNAYYQCVLGEMKQQFCAGGLHWYAKENRCDWPHNAQCHETQQEQEYSATSTKQPSQILWTTTTAMKPTKYTTARPVTRTTRETTPRPVPIISTSVPRQEPCEPGQYYPHEDCESFYICVNGKRVPQQCGPGLQWNTQYKTCDREENVKCVSQNTYLRLIEYRAAEQDRCEGNTRLPYPGDCNQYLYCLHGRLEVQSCAPDLHWNQQLNICDWPANAGCKSSDEGTNPSNPTTPGTTTTPRPTYPTDKPIVDPLSGYYKVVCYFTNWAWYRKGFGRYTPDDINTDLCTHIVYGFAVLDYSDLTLKTHDSWADIDNHFYERVASLKNKGVKVTLALGGWNDSEGDKYSRLVRNPSARAKFIRHAIQFIEKYGFEGLDLDWEYPVCWQTNCDKGFPDEKEGFTALVRELSQEFKPRNLLLSTAVSPSKKIIDAGYDVAELAKYFDWIAVMTYDFHGQWDKRTGHVAPLYYHPDDEFDYFNANFSLNYWIEKGAPSRTIVMGMPLYGQSFTLSDAKNHGLNAHAPGPGQAGEFTKAAGFLAYYEICDRIKTKGWIVEKDKEGRMGPYAYKGNQWVSFDDVETLRRKSQLVRNLNLGGGMIWALDLDDFRNRCGEGVHPLLTTIRNVLRDPPSNHELNEFMSNAEESDDVIVLAEDNQPDTVEEFEINEVDSDPNLEVEEGSFGPAAVTATTSALTDEFKVVCYFTNWAWYRQSGGKFLPEDIDPDLCTHIVYGFAVLDRDNLIIKPHDGWADLDNHFYERVTAFKAKGKKVTVAIGGWNDSAGDKYSRLVRNAAARAKFIKHVVEFIEQNGFDGLDLDWEYPVCWQVECNKGFADEKEGFASLVRELSAVFKPKGLLLSSAVSPNKKVIDAGYDVPILSQYFDWIAVMTYDYHGQWDKKTGHVAPMYEFPGDDPTLNSNYTIHYWIEKGADRKKLVMGMPMYGQSFSLADNGRHGLNTPTYGGGEGGESTMARGFLSYYEICRNIRERGWQVVRDRLGRMGPYAYQRDQWVSFDDSAMIRHKSEYVKAMELGGAMIWALDLDDFQNRCNCESFPLLKTINRVLRNYPGPDPKCKLEDKAEIAPDDEIPEVVTPSTPPTWWPTASTTTNRPTSTDPNQPAEPQPPISSDAVNCNGKNFAAHESDCNKYYQCEFGVLMEHKCPQGLYWNNGHCDWPSNTNCEKQSDEPSVTETKGPVQTTPAAKPTKKPVISPTKGPADRPKPVYPKPIDSKYKVICYFTNWAWYRPGDGKYTPEDIDENLCTHVVYGFAVLNRETLTIKTHDSWADIDNKFYVRVSELRKKGIRVTLAIGGWNDSLGDKYSRLVRNAEARARFVKHVVEFLERYGFEGLDLDWEYPVCWQVDCKKGFPDEKEGFANLVRELSEAFKPKGLLLSAAVSPSKTVIDAGYDVPVLAKYFDWIAVMTYDFHGHWDKQTGHVAPLYYMPGDTYDYFNANFTMNYWMEKGAPANKLIMGMPLYGQSFSLADSGKRGLNSKTYGPGEAGRYTRAGGFLAYYEICEKVNQGGWEVVRDEEERIGPYAYKGSQWVSYDDVEDIRRKSKFVKQLGLAGGMIWALDLDDFRGRCGCGKHPLLRTLNQELRGLSGQRANNCT